MSKNTGGPAFPLPLTDKQERRWNEAMTMGALDDPNGMTLRDYFAAKALQGYISYMGCEAEATGYMGGQNAKVLALNAYKFADAMIAEREKE